MEKRRLVTFKLLLCKLRCVSIITRNTREKGNKDGGGGGGGGGSSSSSSRNIHTHTHYLYKLHDFNGLISWSPLVFKVYKSERKLQLDVL